MKSVAQVLQSARDEHFCGGFALFERQTCFGVGQFAEETQGDRIRPLGTDLFQRVGDGFQSQALFATLVSAQVWAWDLLRGFDEISSLIPLPEEHRLLPGGNSQQPGREGA